MAMATGHKVLLIGGGAALTFLVGRELFAKPKVRPAPPKPEDEPVPDTDWARLVEQFESRPGEPMPGTFYYQRGATKDDKGEWVAGDVAFEIVRWALDNAGIPQSSANRIALLRLIECSPYNDAIYGVKLSDSAFNQRFRSDQPFGISGNPQHHNNVLRMKQGMPVRRGATRHSMTAHEDIPGGAYQAGMWIPLLKPGTTVVGPGSVAAWQDGTSAINPPPELLALGFENVPPGDYGCDPFRMSVEAIF